MSASNNEQHAQKVDGRPIKAADCCLVTKSTIRTKIYAGIRERCNAGIKFVSVGERLDEDVCKELLEAGYRVLQGSYSTLIEWDS